MKKEHAEALFLSSLRQVAHHASGMAPPPAAEEQHHEDIDMAHTALLMFNMASYGVFLNDVGLQHTTKIVKLPGSMLPGQPMPDTMFVDTTTGEYLAVVFFPNDANIVVNAKRYSAFETLVHLVLNVDTEKLSPTDLLKATFARSATQ